MSLKWRAQLPFGSFVDAIDVGWHPAEGQEVSPAEGVSCSGSEAAPAEGQEVSLLRMAPAQGAIILLSHLLFQLSHIASCSENNWIPEFAQHLK